MTDDSNKFAAAAATTPEEKKAAETAGEPAPVDETPFCGPNPDCSGNLTLAQRRQCTDV